MNFANPVLISLSFPKNVVRNRVSGLRSYLSDIKFHLRNYSVFIFFVTLRLAKQSPDCSRQLICHRDDYYIVVAAFHKIFKPVYRSIIPVHMTNYGSGTMYQHLTNVGITSLADTL